MTSPSVVVYTGSNCAYCTRAKHFLAAKGVAYREINVEESTGARAEMQRLSRGSRTVPQIFVGEHHVGGFDDMIALDRKGELDSLLKRG
ncbi:MAG: glutaredoxin 3 [Pseudomonadota bacterium]